MRNSINQTFFCTLLCSGAVLASPQLHALADDENDEDRDQALYVSSGQKITPTAAPRSILQPLNPGLPDIPDFVASGGVSSVVSPDQKTLLILTSGYNLLSDKNGKGVSADSEEYVFVYDISSGTPVKKQVLKVRNTFVGIAFNPNGQRFYVGGGVDDTVHTFTLQSDGTWAEGEALIALGHQAGVGLQASELPLTGGMDVTTDGNSLVVANVYNDSVSVVDLNAHAVAAELDLRPGKIDPAQNGVPGGEYPLGVAVKGNNTAYISSLRDREVDVVSFGSGQANLKTRIKIDGNPNKLILDRSQSRLYVAADNSDDVSVVDTGSNQVVGKIHTVGPDWLLWKVRPYHGAAPNSLALSPDSRVLYVTNGGLNSVAVVRLDFNSLKVVGLVPTGFYPNAVSVSGDGQTLYVVNGKSVTGPNLTYLPKTSPTRDAGNQYILQLEKSSLLSFPVPDFGSLEQLTLTVAANNSLIIRPHSKDARVMKQLQERIKHVIYIVKENRTYDQILGDLDRGNGDPLLVEFGEQTTPNCHRLARSFVDFDNFYDSGDVSANGWPWSTAARESDFGVKAVILNYSSRGTDYEYEGTNRSVNVGLATVAESRRLIL
ncbi:MAG: YncE family protein [Chthoniobacterales bacterium]